MIVIASMQMPESCQTCPFLYAGIDVACCVAKARYEATINDKWGVNAPIICDGADKQRDSDCPLYDDTAIDAALTEIKRLRGELAKYKQPEVSEERPPT